MSPLPATNAQNFIQFLGKFGKIICGRPPTPLAPSPAGNPGSGALFLEQLSTAFLLRISSVLGTIYYM